jgi:hypothetical protein
VVGFATALGLDVPRRTSALVSMGPLKFTHEIFTLLRLFERQTQDKRKAFWSLLSLLP